MVSSSLDRSLQRSGLRWHERWLGQVPAAAVGQRSGQVISLSVRAGHVAAQVQGGAAAPYHVEILVDVLDDEAWQRAVGTIAAQARHRAALQAGRLTDETVADLAAVGADPIAVDRIDARCPCGDTRQPCRHAGAVWAEVGARAAHDPFELLHLRGRGPQQLRGALIAARRRSGIDGDEASLDDLDPHSWHRSAEDLPATVPEPAARSAGPLRLLGDPPGWKGPADAATTFSPLLESGAERALALWRGADDEDGGEPAADAEDA